MRPLLKLAGMVVFIAAATALAIVNRSFPDPLEWKQLAKSTSDSLEWNRLAKSTSNPLEWKRQEMATTTSAAPFATESVDVGGSHYCVWDSVQSKVVCVPWPTNSAAAAKEGNVA